MLMLVEWAYKGLLKDFETKNQDLGGGGRDDGTIPTIIFKNGKNAYMCKTCRPVKRLRLTWRLSVSGM